MDPGTNISQINPHFLLQFLSEQPMEGPKMIGSIQTNEKCPKCKGLFTLIERIGYVCPACFTSPRRLRLDVLWRGRRHKIYSNKQGQTIEGYHQALAVQSIIDEEITAGHFNPAKYRKAQVRKFWTKTVLDEFLKAKKKEIAPSYQSNYEVMVECAKNFFGTIDPREIRKVDLIKYRESICGQGLSPKTVKNYLDHFRTFLRWCRDDVEILDQVPSFPSVDVPEPDFIWVGREAQIKLLEPVSDLHRPFISFLMLHGCRPSEARALKCKDVMLEAGKIKISATFSAGVYRNRRKGRGAKPYMIAIHEECLDYITERVRGNLPEAWLFVNPRTGDYYRQSKIRKLWDRVRVKLGIDKRLRLYDATRHSVASQLRSAGVDLSDVKDQLGQSCLRTTERYAHVDIERLRANLKVLSLKKVVNVRGVSVEEEGEKKAQTNQDVR